MACVLVHIEADGDRPTPASLGALGEGRRLASRFGAGLYAVVLTADHTVEPEVDAADSTIRVGPIDPGSLGRAPLVGELARAGADKVVFVTVDEVHQPPLWATAGAALASACEYLRPLVVIVPTSRGGHDIAPRLAARLGAAYIPDAHIDTTNGAVAACRRVHSTHTRCWVLDDLDRAAVIAITDSAATEQGDDDAEVMLISAQPDVDERVTPLADGAASEGAPSRAGGESPPAGIAVLVRGLLSGPGMRAVAPLGATELAAVKAAVALGKARGAAVTAIAAGSALIHDRALAAALAAGCSRAIRIDFNEADELDYLGLAQILAQAVRRADAGVIVCGDRSSDEATGAVGPAVAELLDAAHLTGVDAIENVDGVVIARREPQRFRVTPPVVLAVAPGDMGDLAAVVTAANGDSGIEALGLDALGLDRRILAHRRATAGAITASEKAETMPGVPVPDLGPEPDRP